MNNRKMIVNKFGNVYGEQFTGMSFAGNVFDITGISPALRTMQGGGNQPMIIVTKQIGFIDKGTGEHQSNRVYDPNGISPTLNTSGGIQIHIMVEVKPNEEDPRSRLC